MRPLTKLKLKDAAVAIGAIIGSLILLFTSGCAHTSVLVEADHVSHISQHEPFTNNPTNYGYDAVSVGLRFRPAKGLTVDLLDGRVLEGYYAGSNSYGALVGPREVFTGRITYEWPLR